MFSLYKNVWIFSANLILQICIWLLLHKMMFAMYILLLMLLSDLTRYGAKCYCCEEILSFLKVRSLFTWTVFSCMRQQMQLKKKSFLRLDRMSASFGKTMTQKVLHWCKAQYRPTSFIQTEISEKAQCLFPLIKTVFCSKNQIHFPHRLSIQVLWGLKRRTHTHTHTHTSLLISQYRRN